MFYGTGWQGEVSPDTPPAWELYDLKNDPGEDNNVYNNPEYASVIAELKGQLRGLRSEYKVDGPEYAYNKAIEDFWEYDEDDRARAMELSYEVLEKHKNGTWTHNVKKSAKKN